MKRFFFVLALASVWLGFATTDSLAQSSPLEVVVLKDHSLILPGSIAKFEFTLTNTSESPITVYVTRTVNELPDSWGSAICTDYCYAPGVDSPDPVTIAPNSTFKPASTDANPYLNIYSGESGDTDARVVLQFKVGQFGTPVSKEFTATFATSSVDTPAELLNNGFAFPNPVATSLTIPLNETYVSGNDVSVEIYSSNGELVEGVAGKYLPASGTIQVNVETLPEGAYFYKTSTGEAIGRGSFIVQH